ncbi:hypothetical protein OJF2_77980 [Aquisphaera giovannonii]|uniref:Uncharacterized protein n=1 Tax=Aquisphaera giovannonii TaxID=406548 RepID=A0A5B9WEW0_9BACT|nr:hypothetical protein [Aquisphaera giovannonii]QEH39186.1 hypothetical protein OJF2_77980 [Aquisphaera giovannonii]
MVSRRQPDPDASSPRWRRAHRGLLAECGVPDEVADSDRRWGYLLLHGDDHPGTGWDASWISPAKAARFLDHLLAGLPDESGCDLVRCLRRRLQ